MPAAATQPAGKRRHSDEQREDSCAFPVWVVGTVVIASNTPGPEVLGAVKQQAGKCLKTKEPSNIWAAIGSVIRSLLDRATAQSLKASSSIAELGSSFESIEARLAEAMAGMQAQLDSCLAAMANQLAATESQRAADSRVAENRHAAAEARIASLRARLADVPVLAEEHICQVAGLVMARLRRREGRGPVQGQNTLDGTVRGQTFSALQSRLTLHGVGAVEAFLQHFNGTWDMRCGKLAHAHSNYMEHPTDEILAARVQKTRSMHAYQHLASNQLKGRFVLDNYSFLKNSCFIR